MKHPRKRYVLDHYDWTLESANKHHIANVLWVYDWNLTYAALALGIDRRTLYRMVKRWKLVRSDKRPSALPTHEIGT